jgi:exodeoxyribonuclease VII large subunit
MTAACASIAPASRRALRVGEVTRLIRGLLDAAPALRGVWVDGEISNLKRPPSGHVYFSLKDDAAVIRCAMFWQAAQGLAFEPKDGLRALARGDVSVFERDGQYQLYVRELEPAGAGALALAFEQLKRKLAAEGLFDPARKRPLPALPRRVALVTSPQGAAARDMIRVAQRRFPGIDLVVVPVLVQGPEAPASIVRGLGLVPATGADVAIVGRGGGSVEELWAFNTEPVARAIRACPVPVVSAVGHETDVTIADFAADLRAPTPSAAAELAVPERAALEDRLDTLARRLRAAARGRLARAWQALDALRDRRALRDPAATLRPMRQRLAGAATRLATAASSRLRNERTRLDGLRCRPVLRDPAAAIAVRRLTFQALSGRLATSGRRIAAPARSALAACAGRLPAVGQRLVEQRRAALRGVVGRLEALSPLAVLARGYSVCRTPSGIVVRRPAQAPAGTDVEILLAEGRLDCRVLSHTPGIEEAAP